MTVRRRQLRSRNNNSISRSTTAFLVLSVVVGVWVSLCVADEEFGVTTHTIDFTSLNISQVTLYPTETEIKHTLRLPLAPGVNEIIVRNPPSDKYQEESIQVKGITVGVVLSSFTTTRLTIPNPERNLSYIHQLKAEINSLSDQLLTLKLQISAADSQSQIYSHIGNQLPHYTSFDDTSSLLSLLSSSSSNLLLQHIDLLLREKQIRKEKEELERTLKIEEQKAENVNENVIIIYVYYHHHHHHHHHQHTTIKQAELQLRYLTYSCSWYPSYDLHVDMNSNTATLSYYASIYQTSGLDWISVPVTLSTKSNKAVEEIPRLNEIYLSISPTPPQPQSQSQQYSKKSMSRQSYGNVMMTSGTMMLMDESESGRGGIFGDGNEYFEVMSDAGSVNMQSQSFQLPPTIIEDNFISAEFQLPPYTCVPHNTNSHSKVLIGTIELEMEMNHVVVPKKSSDVFLRASTINKSEYILLNGIIRTYFNSNYVGTSKLSHMVQPDEKFDLTLGIDQSVRFEYKEEKYKQTEGGFIHSTSEVHDFKYHLFVTNNKKDTIKLWVYDQIPISTEESITVSLIQPKEKQLSFEQNNTNSSSIYLNQQTKNIRWINDIEAFSKSEIHLHYSVAFPEGKYLITKQK